ncbi:hypothetical protein DAI22_02g125400 [Oryza sativa Japonica Group]|nr:hypothetical protein DAI22_02g125400 [Oryza sativa Japonica Group]
MELEEAASVVSSRKLPRAHAAAPLPFTLLFHISPFTLLTWSAPVGNPSQVRSFLRGSFLALSSLPHIYWLAWSAHVAVAYERQRIIRASTPSKKILQSRSIVLTWPNDRSSPATDLLVLG